MRTGEFPGRWSREGMLHGSDRTLARVSGLSASEARVQVLQLRDRQKEKEETLVFFSAAFILPVAPALRDTPPESDWSECSRHDDITRTNTKKRNKQEQENKRGTNTENHKHEQRAGHTKMTSESGTQTRKTHKDEKKEEIRGIIIQDKVKTNPLKKHKQQDTQR